MPILRPAASFHSDHARVSHDVAADELLISFDDGRRIGGLCDRIGLVDGTIAVGHDAEAGGLIGVQGFPFFLGAVRDRSVRLRLARGHLASDPGEQTLHRGRRGFVVEVAVASGPSGPVGVPIVERAAGAPHPGGAVSSWLGAHQERAESRRPPAAAFRQVR